MCGEKMTELRLREAFGQDRDVLLLAKISFSEIRVRVLPLGWSKIYVVIKVVLRNIFTCISKPSSCVV